MTAPELVPQQKVGSYRLLKKLGAGGIGEVWKARDGRLNRVVALKFISPGVNTGPVRDLLREARATSTLNHPNIVTVYEVGELEGGHYLAMEFVDGETLRARLSRAPLAFSEVLDLARQTCGALAVAHKQGIVHRDLKPENIMLRDDGLVKLVDFGLAKMLPWAAGTTPDIMSDSFGGHQSLTETGQVMGTFRYMSPEQARGRPTGPPTDVFSFGIVLYEMVSREHPFRGASTMDTLTAILNKEPEPISVHCPAAPSELHALLTRALAKEEAQRFPSGVELLEALQRVPAASASAAAAPAQAAEPAPKIRQKPRWMQAVGAVLIAGLLAVTGWMLRPGTKTTLEVPVQSVVVMKLRAPADDQRAASIIDAMSEELDAALTRRGFRVASRSASGAATETDVRTLGANLGVDAVLDGTIRSAGSKLRIHVELVSTRTGFQLWNGTVTSEEADPLSAGEKAAAQIADDMKAALAKPK